MSRELSTSEIDNTRNPCIVDKTGNPSFFIPRIDFQFTKNRIKDIFEEISKVNVTRVDFVSFNSEKGVGRRAYIHFEEWSPEITNIYTLIQRDGFIGTVISTGGNPDFSFYEDIRILINKNPVPETKLNLNQVAHNIEFVADQVKVQQELIESQKKVIDEQQQRLFLLEQRMNQMYMMPPPPPSAHYMIPNGMMMMQPFPPLSQKMYSQN